jgi:hypothetical protein
MLKDVFDITRDKVFVLDENGTIIKRVDDDVNDLIDDVVEGIDDVPVEDTEDSVEDDPAMIMTMGLPAPVALEDRFEDANNQESEDYQVLEDIQEPYDNQESAGHTDADTDVCQDEPPQIAAVEPSFDLSLPSVCTSPSDDIMRVRSLCNFSSSVELQSSSAYLQQDGCGQYSMEDSVDDHDDEVKSDVLEEVKEDKDVEALPSSQSLTNDTLSSLPLPPSLPLSTSQLDAGMEAETVSALHNARIDSAPKSPIYVPKDSLSACSSMTPKQRNNYRALQLNPTSSSDYDTSDSASQWDGEDPCNEIVVIPDIPLDEMMDEKKSEDPDIIMLLDDPMTRQLPVVVTSLVEAHPEDEMRLVGVNLTNMSLCGVPLTSSFDQMIPKATLPNLPSNLCQEQTFDIGSMCQYDLEKPPHAYVEDILTCPHNDNSPHKSKPQPNVILLGAEPTKHADDEAVPATEPERVVESTAVNWPIISPILLAAKEEYDNKAVCRETEEALDSIPSSEQSVFQEALNLVNKFVHDDSHSDADSWTSAMLSGVNSLLSVSADLSPAKSLLESIIPSTAVQPQQRITNLDPSTAIRLRESQPQLYAVDDDDEEEDISDDLFLTDKYPFEPPCPADFVKLSPPSLSHSSSQSVGSGEYKQRRHSSTNSISSFRKEDPLSQSSRIISTRTPRRYSEKIDTNASTGNRESGVRGLDPVGNRLTPIHKPKNRDPSCSSSSHSRSKYEVQDISSIDRITFSDDSQSTTNIGPKQRARDEASFTEPPPNAIVFEVRTKQRDRLAQQKKPTFSQKSQGSVSSSTFDSSKKHIQEACNTITKPIQHILPPASDRSFSSSSCEPRIRPRKQTVAEPQAAKPQLTLIQHAETDKKTTPIRTEGDILNTTSVITERLSTQSSSSGSSHNIHRALDNSDGSSNEFSRMSSQSKVSEKHSSMMSKVKLRSDATRQTRIMMGVPQGDIMLSLLNENPDTTWAIRVQEATLRCRSMRQKLDPDWAADQESRAKRVRKAPSSNTNTAAMRQRALEHLYFCELDEALVVYEKIILHLYDRIEEVMKGAGSTSTESITEQIKGFKPLIGTALHDLGVVHLVRGEHDKALNYFQRAATNRASCLGMRHLDHIVSIHTLAYINICLYSLIYA